MRMATRRRFWFVAMALCSSTLLNGCGIYARDAVISGAMDFLSGATTTALGGLLGLA